MIQINLLPVRVQKKKEGARQFASIYLLTVGLAVAIIGFVWMYLRSANRLQRTRAFLPAAGGEQIRQV